MNFLVIHKQMRVDSPEKGSTKESRLKGKHWLKAKETYEGEVEDEKEKFYENKDQGGSLDEHAVVLMEVVTKTWTFSMSLRALTPHLL